MTQAVARRSERPDRSISSSAHALELVRSALGVAELLVEHVVEPTAAGPDARDLTKEVGEVAMLLRLAQRVLETRGTGPASRRSQDASRTLARSGDARNLMVLRPSRAAPHVLAHGCLQQIGCEDGGFDEIARAALSGPPPPGRTNACPTGSSTWPGSGTCCSATASSTTSPRRCRRSARASTSSATTIDDAYAFSHALPYATDFGRVPIPAWADPAWLSGTADALVLKALDEDDLDLLGELLMTPALLRAPWTSVQWFGWRVLCDDLERARLRARARACRRPSRGSPPRSGYAACSAPSTTPPWSAGWPRPRSSRAGGCRPTSRQASRRTPHLSVGSGRPEPCLAPGLGRARTRPARGARRRPRRDGAAPGRE